MIMALDVSMTASGPVVQSFIDHFIQRWNFVKKDKYEREKRYPFLPSNLGISVSNVGTLSKGFVRDLHVSKEKDSEDVTAQLVRSASKWSQGVDHEKSVQNAYIDLIVHSNRTSFWLNDCSLILDFIYIENQFFGSGLF